MFTPRVGQEMLVAFVAGDVDRPVVVGMVYNGQGSADAQGNQVSADVGSATGRAAAWFPAEATQSKLQGHQHNDVLSGYKSQESGASQAGTAGHNQLEFDDTAAAGRIELSSSASATRLQLGHRKTGGDELGFCRCCLRKHSQPTCALSCKLRPIDSLRVRRQPMRFAARHLESGSAYSEGPRPAAP